MSDSKGGDHRCWCLNLSRTEELSLPGTSPERVAGSLLLLNLSDLTSEPFSQLCLSAFLLGLNASPVLALDYWLRWRMSPLCRERRSPELSGPDYIQSEPGCNLSRVAIKKKITEISISAKMSQPTD